MRRSKQCLQQRIVNIKMAFIFCQISLAMRVIQNPPLFVRKIERMLQALKYEVPILRSIPSPTKSGERQRVCCVISKIKS